jgi:hypothetical protein
VPFQIAELRRVAQELQDAHSVSATSRSSRINHVASYIRKLGMLMASDAWFMGLRFVIL